MDKKQARMIVESLPSLYPAMTDDEEEAIWTLLATDKNVGTNEDCISRKQAIDAGKELCETCDEQPNGWCGSCRMNECLKAIEALPPAQPEIIHCKDCQYSEYDVLYGDRFCHYEGRADIVQDNHYCGYAEMETSENRAD